MSTEPSFQRRGIVEGFFGPPWTLSQRTALFSLGERRGMNTYLYAPKDDPYHRERWDQPYPDAQWRDMRELIYRARRHGIDFVYGFHPGKRLHFTAAEPVQRLVEKAGLLHGAGVRTFAVLFDDIPSALEFPDDRERFQGSLARAEAEWLGRILERQPAGWKDVEWWICPSYYTMDPLLPKMFGPFEPGFLETLGTFLPEAVACLWTGPSVVSKTISLAHVRKVTRALNHRLILWDNYPVNDLSMAGEMHLGPVTGRDPRLPEHVYGYLNNPLLQASLSLLPLATCLDYAARPAAYDPEGSWKRAVLEFFGKTALPHWRALREFCERLNASKDKRRPLRLPPAKKAGIERARRYLRSHGNETWSREFRPWLDLLEASLGAGH